MGIISFLKKKFSGNKEETTKKYVVGLEKSSANFSSKLKRLAKKYEKATEEYYEGLLEILVGADVGIALAYNIIEATKDEALQNNLIEPEVINDLLVDKMFIGYLNQGEDITNDLTFQSDGPTVLLVVGVNGVGKTTSIAKLAARYKARGKKILLVAGDTFRAGAVAQLEVWASRLDVPIVLGRENADPASVAYDGIMRGKEIGSDLIIIDTAGRLQTKVNLMAELSKIRRVINREIEGAPHDVFLIIDATTGQNGVLQAKAFAEATGLTGVVITKMDGTSKGGIILAIRDEIGVPVRFIGLGEKLDDLDEFDLEKYLYGLTVGGEE